MVAYDHLTRRDGEALPRTHHLCMRLRQLAKRFNGCLGLAFLVKGQSQNGQNKNGQRQSFGQVPKNDVKESRCHKQGKHGLGKQVEQTPPYRAFVMEFDFVGPVLD